MNVVGEGAGVAVEAHHGGPALGSLYRGSAMSVGRTGPEPESGSPGVWPESASQDSDVDGKSRHPLTPSFEILIRPRRAGPGRLGSSSFGSSAAHDAGGIANRVNPSLVRPIPASFWATPQWTSGKVWRATYSVRIVCKRRLAEGVFRGGAVPTGGMSRFVLLVWSRVNRTSQVLAPQALPRLGVELRRPWLVQASAEQWRSTDADGEEVPHAGDARHEVLRS